MKNLRNQIYQLAKKQAKDVELNANIRSNLRAKNVPKRFFEVLERQNTLNKIISKLYTDYNKSKWFRDPKDILRSANKIL